MNILMIGDIVGKSGRQILLRQLPQLREQYDIAFCVANGENSAGGLGIDSRSIQEICKAGVDCITLGNHIWAKRAFIHEIEREDRVLCPLNAPITWPGQRFYIGTANDYPILVISLLGRVFMDACDDPFRVIENELQYLKKEYGVRMVLVDFHAEASSEKLAMGYFLENQVTAVCGTHTHVQTADERILGTGTAYITDLGMTGPRDGILGMSRTASLARFTTQMPQSYELEEGPALLQAALIRVDPLSGQARQIERLSIGENE